MAESAGRLAGRVAVITGAGAGIARAAAMVFAREGAPVVVAELNKQTGAAAADEITAAGGTARFVPTDATDEASVANLFAAVDRHFGALHVLYNCTGGSLTSDNIVSELDMAVFDRAISFDVRTCVVVLRPGRPRPAARLYRGQGWHRGADESDGGDLRD